MWEPIWASRSRYWLLTRDVSQSCLHRSRTVGSARLRFRWQLYYEFMYFDVPKVVRSPGCDHGHDEESRNGRDIKIDILDGYIWTPERFRRSLEPRKVTGTPREVYGPYWAHVGGREKEQGRGAGPPFPFSFPLFLFLLLVLLPNTSTLSFPLQIR